MKTVYVVTSGDYSDYGIVRIFENLEDAESFCAIKNDAGDTDPCRIEFYNLTESGIFQKTEYHKAIHCRFRRMDDSGYIGSISWRVGYSKEPFSFEFKRVDDCTYKSKIEYWKAIIPTMHTYDQHSETDDLIVEKIVRDSYYIYRAMEEGIC